MPHRRLHPRAPKSARILNVVMCGAICAFGCSEVSSGSKIPNEHTSKDGEPRRDTAFREMDTVSAGIYSRVGDNGMSTRLVDPDDKGTDRPVSTDATGQEVEDTAGEDTDAQVLGETAPDGDTSTILAPTGDTTTQRGTDTDSETVRREDSSPEQDTEVETARDTNDPFDDGSDAAAGDDTGEETERPGDTESDSELIPPCDGTFAVDAVLSSAISTVGIVSWTTDYKDIESAWISFGESLDYGFTAPVDLSISDHRTLLLGLKPLSSYHYRIGVRMGARTCYGEDRTIETTGESTQLAYLAPEVAQPNKRHGGFTVTSLYRSATAVILDSDGAYIWWYQTDLPVAVRARMGANGNHMYIGNLNIGNRGDGALEKVTMDGLAEERFEIPNRHHDFTVLPDGDITYIEYDLEGRGVCDHIVEMGTDGRVKRIVYSLREDFSHLATDAEWCHSNAINYVLREDAYYLSVLAFNAILKIDRASGALVWVFGGEESDFIGETWKRQHQHHVLENGNILLFNNGEGGFKEQLNSLAREFAFDGEVYTEVWQYGGGARSSTFGDVQRLGNGNTMVTYSNAGVIEEIDTATKALVCTFTWETSGGLGYAIRRDSLYGPPQDYR